METDAAVAEAAGWKNFCGIFYRANEALCHFYSASQATEMSLPATSSKHENLNAFN